MIYFLPHGGIYSLRELFLVDCKMKLDTLDLSFLISGMNAESCS